MSLLVGCGQARVRRMIRSFCIMTGVVLCGAACGASSQVQVATPEVAPPEEAVAAAHSAQDEGAEAEAAQPKSNFVNVVAVVPVKDHAVALAWYRRWIGRDADVVPMEGVAEWQIAGSGWLQVALDPEHAGGTSVVVGVRDVDVQRAACIEVGVQVGDVQDYGFIKLVEAVDPDGNKVVFVQEVGGPS